MNDVTQHDLFVFQNELLAAIEGLFTKYLSDSRAVHKEALKTKDVRKLLGCCYNTLQSLRINGKIRWKKLGGTVYYHPDDCRNYCGMDLSKGDVYFEMLHFFNARVIRDKRLRAHHVLLYHALLLMRYHANAINEFTITRRELMQRSRIGSIATYQKCIYELVRFGYITYQPTFNSFVGTKVRLLPLTIVS